VGAITQAQADARYVNATGDTLSGGLMVYGSRTFFAPADPGEPYAVGFRNKSTGGAVYVGATDSTSQPGIQFSGGGGLSLMQISNVGNITNTGTSHSFAAGSIASTAISGLPAASTVAGTALAATGAVGVSTAYARADHVHPALKADDLTDVTVTTPAAGQVLRWNGTAFVNAVLNYTDLTGTAPGGGTASTTIALADTSTGTIGTSTAFARADHTHPYPTATNVGAVSLTGLSTVNGAIRLTSSSTTEAVTVTLPVNFSGSNTGAVQADTRSSPASGYSNPVAAFYAQNTGPAATPTSPKPNEFAFYSLGPAPSSFGGDLTVTGFITGSPKYIPLTSGKSLSSTDRGATLANVRTDALALTITLPAADSGIPVGSRFDILDLSATSSTLVKAEPTVTLNYNSAVTAGQAAGGLGAEVTLPGPFSRATLYKTGATNWVLIAS
jgi:hypothetical protein